MLHSTWLVESADREGQLWELSSLGFWYPQWIWNQPTEKILLKNQLNLNVLICMKKTIYTGMKKKIFNKEQCYASVLDDSVM